MGVEIPQPFVSSIQGPVNVALLSTTIGLHLDPIYTHIAFDTPVVIELKPIEIKPLQIELKPLEIRLTKLPSIRAHLPIDLGVCMSLFGVDLMGVRLCGEMQMITEDYEKNPCERCGDAHGQPANG